jgi:ring-1,2-phenylacetyl-CoA epoxidase subunit PaaB
VTDRLPSPDDPVASGNGWILWEVFVRVRRGLAHTHVGSVLATDEHMALRYGRDLFSRRGDPLNIWVVPSASITASEPDEVDSFFTSARGKTYRDAGSYRVPDGVQQL